ncbi:hypothetical protein [Roseibium sp. Sym1]|uniref:hypothetical protein n=1 Tax=Roseibium sp. Sym1 TaxID=3016006 RepID=UPI0022B46469|nr:hypothetical protein [Roseibium sp. Sym1]
MAKPKNRLYRMALPKDPLFRLLVINGLAGIGIAGLVMGGIFAANIGNLRVLVLSSENPVLPVVMLAFALVITLGSVVIGSAIMLLGESGRGGGRSGGRRRKVFAGELKPIPVIVPAQQRRGLYR